MGRTLFHWSPGRETALAALVGFVAVDLSLAMIPLQPYPWAEIVVRDLLQVFLVGFVLPLVWIRRTGGAFAAFGFSLRRWPLYLAINLVLAALLLWGMHRGGPPPADFQWDAATSWKAGYVFAAVTFETLFFYSFLRTLFERAFGAVAGIVLAAGFYSLHHAGFQPEFAKLFAVGVMYATVFRLGNSALLVWPFFIGVGGIYDVLIRSKVVAPIEHAELRTVGLAVLMLTAAFVLARRPVNAAARTAP